MDNEFIRLDTTIMGIDNLINEAPTGSQARALFCAKDMIYDQQRYVSEMKPVDRERETVKIKDEDFMTQGYLTIEKYYCCPKCGEVFGNVRMNKKSQLSEMYKFCYNCGQGLKWD